MYVNKQILCNYNVDCNPQDFLFIGTDYVAFTTYLQEEYGYTQEQIAKIQNWYVEK